MVDDDSWKCKTLLSANQKLVNNTITSYKMKAIRKFVYFFIFGKLATN